MCVRACACMRVCVCACVLVCACVRVFVCVIHKKTSCALLLVLKVLPSDIFHVMHAPEIAKCTRSNGRIALELPPLGPKQCLHNDGRPHALKLYNRYALL